MKILVASQYYYPEPFRLHEICEELVAGGNQVTVLTTNPNYPGGEIYDGYLNRRTEEIINGVKIIRVKSRPRHQGSFNLALSYLSFCINASIEAIKLRDVYDVIFAYQLSPITSVVPAIIYKRKNNIPILLYCLDIWPDSLKGSPLEKGVLYKIIKKLSIYIYRSADKILVTSPCFVKYLNNLCNINDVKVLYQHATEVQTVEVPDELRHYMKYINFMFMGNIGTSQNIECIFKAVSLIKDRHKFKVHMVGSGSFLQRSKELAIKLKIDDTIIFHGRRPKEEMPKFYSIADVCIVSLKDEGIVGYTIPGKLQEYMAAGKAILGCINGDARKLIEKFNCGICVEANNSKLLAAAFLKYVENPKLIYSYRCNSRKTYYDKFSLNIFTNKLLSILKKVKE